LNSGAMQAKFRSLLGLAKVTRVPTYEYICAAGHAFEAFQKISERPKSKCPTCGKPASRKISGGAGLVFKGSGFYITDYGKDGKGPRKEKSEAPVAEAAPTPKPEAKPDVKSDAKKPKTKASK
jgi:putative FmdB family regulatory protein